MNPNEPASAWLHYAGSGPALPWDAYMELLDYIDTTIADVDRKRDAIGALDSLFDETSAARRGAA